MPKMDLNKQAREIMKIAEASGVQSNFFFVTTFKKYQVQLNVLGEVEKKMNKKGIFVAKTDAKGQEDLGCSQLVADYNKTTDSSNKTAATLLRIIKEFQVDESKKELDPLLQMINGKNNGK